MRMAAFMETISRNYNGICVKKGANPVFTQKDILSSLQSFFDGV